MSVVAPIRPQIERCCVCVGSEYVVGGPLCRDCSIVASVYMRPRTLYLIEAVGSGRIKIGRAESVPRRMQALAAGSPYPLRVIATVPGAGEFEGRLHRRFVAERVHGEWFRDAPEIRAWFASYTPVVALLPRKVPTLRVPMRVAPDRFNCMGCSNDFPAREISLGLCPSCTTRLDPR